MSTNKHRIKASSSAAGKSARRRTASSVDAVELEPLDFDNAAAREKLRTASNLKGTPLARKSRAKRISRAQLMRLAEKPDELSYMSTSEIFEHSASHIAYLNLEDLVDASDGSDTAARAVIDRLSKTRKFAAEEVVCSSRNTRRYLAILRTGSIRIVYECKFFGYKPIHILIKKIGPGAIFGNMELWGQNLSKLKPIASEPCEVAFLDKRGAEALFKSSSQLSLRLLHINGPKFCELQLWNYNHLRRKCGLEPIEG
jgi:hypothetical protein